MFYFLTEPKPDTGIPDIFGTAPEPDTWMFSGINFAYS